MACTLRLLAHVFMRWAIASGRLSHEERPRPARGANWPNAGWNGDVAPSRARPPAWRVCPIIARSSSWKHVMKFKADALVGFILCHSLAVLALFPWFFSWTGVVLLAFGIWRLAFWDQCWLPSAHNAPRFHVPALARAHVRRPWHVLFAVLAGLVGSRPSSAPPPCG